MRGDGAGETADASDRVPVTPEQIAAAAIAATQAGAPVVHIHVRDPETGLGSRDVSLYREVVERIRGSDVDPVLNLTAGMGGDLVLGGDDSPLPLDDAGTDMAGAAERLGPRRGAAPEICTLDCGSMNFAAGGDYVMVNTPGMLRAMAGRTRELGVRPELEVFDTGHLVMVKHLMRLMTYRAAELADAGQPFSTEAMAKLVASVAAWFATWAAAQTLGGAGYVCRSLVQKRLRDAKLDETWDGTSDIIRLIIARSMFR